MTADSTRFPLSERLISPGAGRRAHLLGICGAGMQALGEMLSDRGWKVSGCDLDPDPISRETLSGLGVSVRRGHQASHLENSPDLLIYSAAIPPDNIERQISRILKIPEWSYVEALAVLSRSLTALAIAGTHGKSTTTAMLGTILERAGRSPTVLCGAELIHRQRSGWGGTGKELVVEACEYRSHFLQLKPALACVLGIEPDHFDCFPGFDDAKAAYRQFLESVGTQGTLVCRRDCPVTFPLLPQTGGRIITFSLTDPDADWTARDVQPVDRGMRLMLSSRDGSRAEVSLQVGGRHNVANALAATACASAVGVQLPDIVAGLQAFRGLRRRGEWKQTPWQSPVIDDYAHHPTEISAALSAARVQAGAGRVICVFQPHQISRTHMLMRQFVEALQLADRVYLLPVYAAREAGGPERRDLVVEMAERLVKQGTSAGLIETLDQVWPTLQTDARSSDLIMTLGAGDLTRVHQ